MAAKRRRSANQLGMTALLVGSVIMIIAGMGAIVDLSLRGIDPGFSRRTGKQVEFALNDFSGKTIRLSDYRGRNVIINLWATWCPPCRAEMPDLIAFYRAHANDDLIWFAVDTQDDATKAQDFVCDQGMPFSVLFDPDARAMNALGADALPDTFVIDRDGIVRFAWTGQISPSILEQRVAPRLRK